MQAGEQCGICGNDYDPMHACHHEAYTVLDALMLIHEMMLDIDGDGRPAPYRIEKLSWVIGRLLKVERQNETPPPAHSVHERETARDIVSMLKATLAIDDRDPWRPGLEYAIEMIEAAYRSRNASATADRPKAVTPNLNGV